MRRVGEGQRRCAGREPQHVQRPRVGKAGGVLRERRSGLRGLQQARRQSGRKKVVGVGLVQIMKERSASGVEGV